MRSGLVAIEALKEERTLQELAKEFQIHPDQIGRLKNPLLGNAGTIHERKEYSGKESRDRPDMETNGAKKAHATVRQGNVPPISILRIPEAGPGIGEGWDNPDIEAYPSDDARDGPQNPFSPSINLTLPGTEHPVYPHLLRGTRIRYPNQAWATEITYRRLIGGLVSRGAIMGLDSWRDNTFVGELSNMKIST